MQHLKRISLFFIVLYFLFILMNGFELFWNSMGYLNPLKRSMFSVIEQEFWVHRWLDLLDYAGKIVFLLLCNHFVTKNQLGKGYHFLVVLICFVPFVYLVLSFLIWKKLNRTLFIYSGMSFLRSELKIIFLWILILIRTIGPWIYYVWINYLNPPESVSTLADYSNYESIAISVLALTFSILYLSYFWEFRKMTRKIESKIIPISENQLQDD